MHSSGEAAQVQLLALAPFGAADCGALGAAAVPDVGLSGGWGGVWQYRDSVCVAVHWQ